MHGNILEQQDAHHEAFFLLSRWNMQEKVQPQPEQGPQLK